MEQYGIIGHPLQHSFSAEYFNEKFRNESIDAIYNAFDIDRIEKVQEIIASHPTLGGLNVTAPYKEKIIEYLDELSPEIRKIGACNVIKVDRGGGGTPRLIGYNTDYIAFKQSITPMLESHHKAALVLGTGGAAKAVQLVMKELGIDAVLVSRYNRPGTVNYKNLTTDDLHTYNVIINATPCGMFPKSDDCPNIPYEGVNSHTLMYDLIYNPDITRFLYNGQRQGATIKNGLEMWLLQAEATWKIWNN